MAPINVLVLTTTRDVKAEVIGNAIAERTDMRLIGGGVLSVEEGDKLLTSSIIFGERPLVVLVGPRAETETSTTHWLRKHTHVVIFRSEIVDDIVSIELRNPGLTCILDSLRGLMDYDSNQTQHRGSKISLQRITSASMQSAGACFGGIVDRPLMCVAIDWIHKTLRNAVACVPDGNGDLSGLSVSRATILESLDSLQDVDLSVAKEEIDRLDASFSQLLRSTSARRDPLATVFHTLGLEQLEMRVLLLCLAPELDYRYQRCVGFLLDEISRRAGTIGLYLALLGSAPKVRCTFANAGTLARWRVFDMDFGQLPSSDEPLRLDPYMADWLLGNDSALGNDPRLRRVRRGSSWPGAILLSREEDRICAQNLWRKLQESGTSRIVLLGGGHSAAWRALLELGASGAGGDLVRIELLHLMDVDGVEVEECAVRICRMSRLTGCPLVIDATEIDDIARLGDTLSRLLNMIDNVQCTAAVICPDVGRIIQLLGSVPCELLNEIPAYASMHLATVKVAASEAGVPVTDEVARSIANRYPLHIDGIWNAMQLSRVRYVNGLAGYDAIEKFIGACQEVAAQDVSHLAERIEPVFSLEDIILPDDRKQELVEIADSIRLAPRVLDEWKFSRILPYGRGVAALFHGPSGTGKTMAAMAVARQLGIQILRLDLSRVVSKYIGETEKNIDRVFGDAQKSGSVILIDEADALFGKRSEVSDAHDRYANIEVAYLLQRIEAYEGLAILTTNLRQNLDPAFLRRLRFVIEFPRPDVDAREQIWRKCLPDEAHVLDGTSFRQLARKINVTGGSIRQITLRAAFIAAASGAPIGLIHIAHAARAEYAKLGMAPVEMDFIDKRIAA
ncbi:ATP-binding protein [Paraburkholderia terrae]|uniref:ATP-binding protein n=1 Tax=Paraburkholderia terrae TaxID=311230 RepID=UPI00296B11E6|nr:ATP-binding protein [Paraburkholderia terrae]MDW3660591.1 ATP-binding protein [Paraburkholderia terrae]